MTQQRKTVRTYSDHDKLRAVAAYVSTGTVNKASQIVEIPRRTMADWSQQEWWHEAVQRVRTEKEGELDAKITAIIDKAFDTVAERLENGETVVNPKTGERYARPISGRDAGWLGAVLFDKQRILRNLPTSISENRSSDQLEKMARQFEKISKQSEAKTIEGQFERMNED